MRLVADLVKLAVMYRARGRCAASAPLYRGIIGKISGKLRKLSAFGRKTRETSIPDRDGRTYLSAREKWCCQWRRPSIHHEEVIMNCAVSFDATSTIQAPGAIMPSGSFRWRSGCFLKRRAESVRM
jgi:hypothetical protein